MSGNAAEKMLEKMRTSPNGWGQHDFETLFSGFGFVRKGTKHDVYIHHEYHEFSISIPRHNEVKPCYARDAVRLIDELKEKLRESGKPSKEDLENGKS